MIADEKTIHAIYEKGVFRPTEQVDLPERCEVEFEPKVLTGQNDKSQAMKKIYEILSLRFKTGERDLAARHDELRP